MNNILQLKGSFEYQKGKGGGGARSFPAGGYIKSKKIARLIEELKVVKEYWNNQDYISGALITVDYNRIVAKSNRIRTLLSFKSFEANDYIRGAKFSEDLPKKHIFTYYVPLEVIDQAIDKLSWSKEYIDNQFDCTLTKEQLDSISSKKVPYNNRKQSRSSFIGSVVDAYYIDGFRVDIPNRENDGDLLVTIYETELTLKALFDKIGVGFNNVKTIDQNTVLLQEDQARLLFDKAPFLVEMFVRDMREIHLDDISFNDDGIVQIPSPTNEPYIGVIDTPFDENVYFGEWVDYVPKISKDIPLESKDYYHGTSVSSIIVDGPTINPNLDDGCGRFRVRHFGVAKSGSFSSFTVLKEIREAVSQNRDIKVWNLSLGSRTEINNNFISPEGAELDRIQTEYDVIFVVAGTNRLDNQPEGMKIGAPADSLNSLVVNSCKLDKSPASYYRCGPVLSFFHKPDISYYGGDTNELMEVCSNMGQGFVKGTSFSAPWIARKLAYMINILGLSRELAKALLIDSAAGWERKDDISCTIGYGVVPQKIEDIVATQDDEIRFLLSGRTEEYETYTYNLPVPIDNGKQPFYARATLCYFPFCNRLQGVDYTSTEMDIHFGRAEEKDGKVKIHSLPSYSKDDYEDNPLFESEARLLYRKWDNVKVISDTIMSRKVPKKVYGMGNWGLSIKTYERVSAKNGKGMPFGIVVTLKEMNGVNRIDDFIKLCQVRGWLVSQIDVQAQLDIYNKAEEEISF